jgi:hypothetical protein
VLQISAHTISVWIQRAIIFTPSSAKQALAQWLQAATHSFKALIKF